MIGPTWVERTTGANGDVGSIVFSILSTADIEAMSAVVVTKADAWDDATQAPVVGGVLDARMGPAMSTHTLLISTLTSVAATSAPCETCGGEFVARSVQTYAQCGDRESYTCPGHMGSIRLPAPIYLATVVDTLADVLRAFCYACGHSLLAGVQRRRTLALARRETTMTGLMRLLREAASSWCRHCERRQPKITRQRGTLPSDAQRWFPIGMQFEDARAPLAAPRAASALPSRRAQPLPIDPTLAGVCLPMTGVWMTNVGRSSHPLRFARDASSIRLLAARRAPSTSSSRRRAPVAWSAPMWCTFSSRSCTRRFPSCRRVRERRYRRHIDAVPSCSMS